MKVRLGLSRSEANEVGCIHVEPVVRAEVLRWAAASRCEVVAALFGAVDRARVTVQAWRACDAAAADASSFAVPIAALHDMALERGDLRLLGIVHSHPDAPPDLSLGDYEAIRRGHWLWGIAGLAEGEARIRWYLRRDGGVHEVPAG